MIKRYNNLSLLFFVPGIIMQMAGIILRNSPNRTESFAALVFALLAVGTVLAITGFVYYAKAKGRSWIWGIVGVAGWLGLLVLVFLKDRSGDPWNT